MFGIAEAAAGGGSPGAVTLALIAAGSAFLGVIVGGLIQMSVEERRAKHQQELEDRRAATQRELDEAQATREREAAEREVTARSKSAARILRNDLGWARMNFEIAKSEHRWWAVDPVRVRVDPDDRRVLASQLELEQWEHVSYTEGFVDAAYARRNVRVSSGTMSLDDSDISEMQHGISVISQARLDLAELAR